MNARVATAPRLPQLVVVWRVFDACNLACKFCGFSSELTWPRNSAAPAETLRFGRILCELQQQTGRSILVSWLGGEPLLWPSLLPLSRAFRREFGLRLGVTTNGLPLADVQVRRTLIEEFEQVTVSIDGLGPFHDLVRGQPGLFRELRENLACLCAEDVENRLLRRVNTVLMRGNIEHFAEFAATMADWGFRELTFNQLGGNDRPEFYPANRLLPEQVESFVQNLPGLRVALAQRSLQISGSEQYLQRIRATTTGAAIPIEDCLPGTEFLFIDPLGRISPCSFSSAAYGIRLAEVQSARDLLELPARFAALRVCSRLAACDDCHATHEFAKFDRPASRLERHFQEAT